MSEKERESEKEGREVEKIEDEDKEITTFFDSIERTTSYEDRTEGSGYEKEDGENGEEGNEKEDDCFISTSSSSSFDFSTSTSKTAAVKFHKKENVDNDSSSSSSSSEQSEVNSSQERAEKAEIDETIEDFKRKHAPRLPLPVILPPQETTLQNPSYVPRRQRQRKSNQNSIQTFLTYSTAGISTVTGTSPSSLPNKSFLSLPQSSPSPSPSSSSSSSSPAVTDISLHHEQPHRPEIAMARRIRAMHPLLRRRYLNRCAQVAAASGASRSSFSSSSFFSFSSSFLLLLLRCCAFLETDF
ncbi:uncharacterized protein MONOS_14463 [Monocercomonoides exilis]|uniref:uncharacterized protein n=1 Tax=Monocercomonoides exilis TaxID=2049356 RepID=UPI00355AC478|nr:hypothetical protein MONOS_14463 [Monocercomonoides exilis]|eukprot:MONOS_14463.1-p1 / transcript=MONOS_14463.1 / gene=MONOS_14463 / organism=Monocercomonoides_exilis_PA203 / gene_product=unspecified product / transcript_product=unspecified product / location=Mono_scaffold01006:9694-10746(-) / protein_length=299 / sequence_SO=supercontig / SO=protein_coding / is_pseudo=false